MTATVSGHEVAERLRAAFPEAVIEETDDWVTVPADQIVAVARFLRDDSDLDCKYLNSLTAVDWLDHFEMVYHLSSLAQNRTLVVKARADHDEPVVPSVTSVWEAANLQEREAFDLMGISFSNHPRLRRVFLWEGFPGHPLRKDFLSLPGDFRPGLQRFPFEFKDGMPAYDTLTEPAAGTLTRSADQPAEDQA